MSRFRFELAKQDDDAELRQLVAATPMAGAVSISFRREPSFFGAAAVEGPFYQTIVARDDWRQRIAGLATRSVRQRFVNGTPRSVGYISSLRFLPEYRKSTLLARGFEFLKALHEDRRAEFYLTTIAEDNASAVKSLIGARANLPAYHDLGRYHTLVIPFGAATDSEKKGWVRRAQRNDLDALVQFTHCMGVARQYMPLYGASDFGCGRGTFRDLGLHDLWLAWRGDRLAGTLACWDQSSYRQSVIEGYSSALGWSRPLYNGWAAASGRPRLPAVGRQLRYVSAALPLVENDDPEVFGALLAAVRAARPPNVEYLLLGLHEKDPLLPMACRYNTAQYLTRLFGVCWPDGESAWREIDGRRPYLELGCL